MLLEIEEIRRRLQDRRPGLVAKACGVHYSTIRRIIDGRGNNPTYDVIKSLSEYLTGGEHD